ncbi:MAG: DUF6015 family protein [Methanobacteriota archaeon]
MTLITVYQLSKAIENALEIEYSEAKDYANIVMDFFGFEDRIIDNVLTSEERQLFYRLQKAGIISAEREDAVLPSGCPWRIHYWRLEKDTIVHFTKNKKLLTRTAMRLEKTIQRSIYEDLYSTVPLDLWSTRKIVDS